jgi:hypothetical protein
MAAGLPVQDRHSAANRLVVQPFLSNSAIPLAMRNRERMQAVVDHTEAQL